MSVGHVAVGHPVDVASGVVFTASHDFYLPGLMDLDWRRRFSNDSVVDSWLGRGWSTPYFMRLDQTSDGYVFTDEEGRTLIFPVPAGGLEVGKPIINFGANLEFRREADHFSILHWHHGEDDIERYCFKPGKDGRMPLAWIENLAGHRITLQYDKKGRIARIVQETEQRVIELSYDRRDLITSIHYLPDAGGQLLLARYEYDEDRRLIGKVDVEGNRTGYEYDSDHRMIGETNPLGSTFTFRYDKQGRCIYTSAQDGFLERHLQYIQASRLTRVTDSLGYVTEYYVNPAGQVIQEVSPIGAIKTTQYDEYGRPTMIRAPNGGVMMYGYDDFGNRTLALNEDGGEYQFKFNSLHRMTELTDPMGSKWVYAYDDRGNVMSVTNPLGNSMSCVRDSRGLVVESRMAGGLTIGRRYDPRFRWQEHFDQISLIRRLEYDERGNETATYDALGLENRTRYDDLNRPVEVEDSGGNRITLKWNGLGLLVERNESSGGWERWGYDRFGRLVSHTTAMGQMSLEYDTEENLTAVINRAGERLERRYDGAGRIVEQRFFDGRIERYEYNLEDRPTQIVKSDGRIIANEYDQAGFLVKRQSSDGLHEEYVYNKNARLVRAQNADAVVELERNALGHIIADTQNGRRVEYTYDKDNNRISRRLDGISGADLSLKYDLRGRLIAIIDAAGTCQELSWDNVNRLAERRFPGGVVETFAYHKSRLLQEQKVASIRGSAIVNRSYEYDQKDNVLVKEDSRRGRFQFEYDDINRLTEVRRSGQPAESYRYNAIGAILETHRGKRDVVQGGRTLQDGSRQFQYDDNGCVARITSNQIDLELTHDTRGVITEAKQHDELKIRYTYDPLGRRMSKQVAGEKTEFVWEGCDLAAEIKDGKVSSSFCFLNREPISQWQESRRLIPILDCTSAVQEVLDEYGDLLWQCTLDAYGSVVSETGSQPSQFRFRGQYHDRETGLHYNFYRFYDPRLGDFVAPDPVGLAGGANLYAYPRNPLVWDDPFGLTCNKKKCKGAAGEAAMEAEMKKRGYDRVDSKGRPRGIDGVFEKNPDDGVPPKFVIGEAKFGSSPIGQTKHSEQQMSDTWIDTGIGKPSPSNADRLERAVGPAKAAEIQAAAATPGNVTKEVHTLPDYGKTATVTKTGDYTPGSGQKTW